MYLSTPKGLNDEVLDVRAAAMSVLARAAHYDVLHVMPVVRLMTKRLMRQLQNTNEIGDRIFLLLTSSASSTS